MKRSAFTLMELIFVIVVIGILSKFGVEIFLQISEGYARSVYINDLQTKSANAIQTIANRLTYRIKDSISATSIGSSNVTWTGFDIDGWLDNEWSGIVDFDDSNSSGLKSPGTTAAASGPTIFFIGSNVGTGIIEYHAVTAGADSLAGNFSGKDVYAFYQMTDGTHTLQLSGTQLRYDTLLLVDNVSEFFVAKLGDGIHVRLCLSYTGNPLVEGEACKEKFIF